jgi:hypothetical protein
MNPAGIGSSICGSRKSAQYLALVSHIDWHLLTERESTILEDLNVLGRRLSWRTRTSHSPPAILTAAAALGKRIVRSLSWSFSLHLSKSHTDAAAVVLNEFDSSRLKGAANHDQGCPARLNYAGFQLAHRDDPDSGLSCVRGRAKNSASLSLKMRVASITQSPHRSCRTRYGPAALRLPALVPS